MGFNDAMIEKKYEIFFRKKNRLKKISKYLRIFFYMMYLRYYHHFSLKKSSTSLVKHIKFSKRSKEYIIVKKIKKLGARRG